MMRLNLLSCLLLVVLGLVQGLSSSGDRLLVITDEPKEQQYTKFYTDLKDRGFILSIEAPKSDPELFRLGERMYDHLLILPSKLKALGPTLTPQLILDFVKYDGNVLLALSSSKPTPSTLNSLLLELGISLPSDRDALVVDHFNYDTSSSSDRHDVILVPQPDSLRKGVKNYFGGEGLLAVPRAVGQTLGNASPLLASVLKAPATAYSYNPKDESESVVDPFAVGQQLSLVSAMQARNSARFTVLGSAEMLEDQWFDASIKSVGGTSSKTANREFAKQLSAWTFKELGVLRVGRLLHYLNEEPSKGSTNGTSVGHQELNPKIYRIKNEVTYNIELSEHEIDQWTPFAPARDDFLQLEFTMLSPYHRLNLEPQSMTSNSTVFGTSFKLPDQHGIFNFRVNYKRPFLTTIDEKDTVTVRHFAHDEWPRSYAISGAYVWLTGIWVTVAGWVFFVGIWLFAAPSQDEKRKIKKTQ